MEGIVLEFFEVVKKRRSILCFTADEVSDEDLMDKSSTTSRRIRN